MIETTPNASRFTPPPHSRKTISSKSTAVVFTCPRHGQSRYRDGDQLTPVAAGVRGKSRIPHIFQAREDVLLEAPDQSDASN
ncbi:hypothetical protein JTE90_022047 [Oedothorax gibbosus]|uniref:Uncharacterized protein n=1 Tax=Oedothorax gibbosus TaxID=931172 RepID=A0AAV6V101_9ARAC|nr:hypothetical protein JTE90_022047 [Oedothorax gibbosus]